MAPDAEYYEEVEQLNDKDVLHVPVHGRRILPHLMPPANAWVENEELERLNDSRTNSPGENRRLLSPNVQKQTRLQAGLTLGVKDIKKHTKCPQIAKKVKPKEKSKFQRRKEKLIVVLRPPYFIITMIVLIVLIHLCRPEWLQKHLEWPSGAWWREPWRLFTYGFIHAGAGHLALNALVALALGWRLEREQGWARVAAVWAGGVAAGALGAGALQPRVRVVGASAAVYALLTAHLPNVCLRFGHVPLWWFRPLSVVVLGVSEGCWALAQPRGAGLAQVAWAAHALGAAAGVPLGFLVFTGENISNTYIRACRVFSAILLLLGVLGAAAHYIIWYEIDPYT
ncbi:rhomboid-related protein 2-like [Epargyreus clarus]|uniref:rhomboid-related protein 2-like n=1 Tax=Epargyreus clarus TaxID=520877 RepID=UPI003C2F800D